MIFKLLLTRGWVSEPPAIILSRRPCVISTWCLVGKEHMDAGGRVSEFGASLAGPLNMNQHMLGVFWGTWSSSRTSSIASL